MYYRTTSYIKHKTLIAKLKPFVGDSKVRDLQFNPELRRFEWLPPHAPEECDLEYNINFSNELIGTESTTPDEFYEFPVYFCSNNWISVTTIITTQGDSLVGDYAVGTHIEGIPGKNISRRSSYIFNSSTLNVL